MADDLTVGGPGTTTVVTTALVDEAGRMRRLYRELESCHDWLVRIDRVIGPGILAAADAPRSAILAERDIDTAVAALKRAITESELLARGLDSAADGFEFAERFADRLSQQLAANFGNLLGSIAPVILALLLPGAIAVGGVSLGILTLLPEPVRARVLAELGEWLRTHSAVLSDPRFVQAVRLSVMSADDAGWGLVKVPAPLSSALGDEGLGIFGVDTSAAVIAALASGVGVLRETPVKVTAGASARGLPAVEGVQDRVERIPSEPEQIRIDKYSTPGRPDRFEVYIAGTADLAISGDTEPWDMTSNVTAMAGGSAASYRAVVEAMRLAGIDSTSHVTITGYSQGGLIAAKVVASGAFQVDGLVTFGAPAGQVAVPHDIPYVAIEHTNDLVPALGGSFASSEPLVIRRELFDGPPPPSDFALPAHQLTNYLDTAGLVDASDNLKIRQILNRLPHDAAGSVTSTVYRAERTGG